MADSMKISERKCFEFLRNVDLWPLDKSKWKKLSVTHGNQDQWGNVRKVIRSNVGEKGNGIYVYKNARGTILYVGEGKLVKRLLSHHSDSLRTVDRSKRGWQWRKFFSDKKNARDLNIYWVGMNNDHIRKSIEQLITYVANPKFINQKGNH
jgi:hypothetical protein